MFYGLYMCIKKYKYLTTGSRVKHIEPKPIRVFFNSEKFFYLRE